MEGINGERGIVEKREGRVKGRGLEEGVKGGGIGDLWK